MASPKDAGDGSRRRKREPPASAPQKVNPPNGAERVATPAVATPEGLTQRVHSVVGIGASAGGLEAFSQFLQALDPNTGMAFVFVQHLAPKHESFLPELLASNTSLPVKQIRDGMPLQPNHVFVIPPNAHVNIQQGKLHLLPRPEGRAQYMPIDAFLRSLASWGDGHTIGVILSGTATDGAAGLREIKAVGGITMVQDPGTAKYDGMPRAAIATDVVDFVLPPSGIAAELQRISRHPFVKTLPTKIDDDAEAPPDVHLQKIYTLLRKQVGCDFSQYKISTIMRRLQRRMVLHKASSLEQYVRLLETTTSEVHALYEDILIHVTSFFREPDTYETIKTAVLPQLLEKRKSDDPLRFWVPACSTGEEAYSLAIVALEVLEEETARFPFQIFATDISESSVQRARAGIYPESIAADVPADRLRRFFTRSEGSYRVSKQVRDVCVFARQDVTRDPPFSRIDFIACRNLLIYLGLPMQRRLIQMFHYALKPGGFLMLGSAETIGAQSDLFTITNKSQRIYLRKDGVAPSGASSPATDFARPRLEPMPRPVPSRGNNLHQEASQLLLARYAPPGVIVNEELRIVQFRGQTGAYIEPAPGDASLQLLKMLREGLLNGTRSALQEARKSNQIVRRAGLPLRQDGRLKKIDIVVIPLANTAEGRHFALLFEEERTRQPDEPAPEAAPAKKEARKPAGKRTDDRALIEELQQELAASRDFLQSINQDLEAANEELQSANEEILSNNEELQSTNEELDTAKEEMQSTNEELNTVNDELRGRNDELSRANSDLVNLLASVQIAIVIVGANLRIRRFTPMAEKILNLIPSDIGRPLGDIKPNIEHHSIEGLIAEVIDTMATKELEVKDRQGKAYSLRIRPYKNLENRIDGAVLALFDVDATSRDRQRLRDAMDLTEAMMAVANEPLVVLDSNLVVERANAAFLRAFGVKREEVIGVLFCHLTHGKWNVAELQQRLEHVAPDRAAIQRIPVEYEFPGIGRREIGLNVRRLTLADGGVLLLAFDGLETSRKASQ